MSQLAEHLSILGLDVSASAVKLKAAYHREILKWHPDLFHCDLANQPAATERTKKINAAYEYLSELHELGSLPLSNPRSTEQQSDSSPLQPTYQTQHTYNRKPFTPGFSDPSVVEIFIKSSHIISAGYKRATQTLYIKFDENVVYSYLQVPESVYTAFMSAESHGKFAHRYIYHHYHSSRH